MAETSEALEHRRRREVGLCSVLAVPGFAWCSLAHICMAGHLAHPPYPLWDRALESRWIAALIGVVVLGARTRMPRKTVVLTAAVVILVSRLLLGSGGGGLWAVEVPLIAWLGIRGARAVGRQEQEKERAQA